MNAPINQLDCRKCEGWGCGLCRPHAGEQEDVELKEIDQRIAAAVREEREACAKAIEPHRGSHGWYLAALIRARSKA